MALSFTFVTVPRGYEVASGATHKLCLTARDCSRYSICHPCAEGGDAVRLRDGECPRCLTVDYTEDDYTEEDYTEETECLPPFSVETAFGKVEVTPLADGRHVFKGAGTFGCRETIRAASLAAGLGAGWNPMDKTWTVAAGTDLRAALPAPPPAPPPPPAPRPRELWSREEYQMWLARSRRKVHGPCCSHAVSYESRPYGPICYRCELHGITHNSWTGD
jgi:hypothetical protein